MDTRPDKTDKGGKDKDTKGKDKDKKDEKESEKKEEKKVRITYCPEIGDVLMSSTITLAAT